MYKLYCHYTDLPLPSSTSDAACSGRVFYRRYPSRGGPLSLSKGWQERGQQADERQVGAELVHCLYVGRIGQLTQQGGAYAPHAEGEAEEEAGDGADLAGHQLLGVDQDGGEGRRQDEADDHREH